MREGIDSKQKPTQIGRGPLRMGRSALCGIFTALAVMLAIPGCGESNNGDDSNKVNGSIHVPAGKPPGAVATVNGSIQIDDNAAVTNATTVNGGVQLGDHASAASLSSVNGSIVLGADAHVSGSASSVNGALTLEDGADISGSLSNVNGKITLTAAHVGGVIKTIDGGIDISGASRVEGGILVEKASGMFMQMFRNVPRIVIGPGAAVLGNLRFEHTVKLFVSDKATIGAVSGATPIPFSGDTPPN